MPCHGPGSTLLEVQQICWFLLQEPSRTFGLPGSPVMQTSNAKPSWRMSPSAFPPAFGAAVGGSSSQIPLCFSASQLLFYHVETMPSQAPAPRDVVAGGYRTPSSSQSRRSASISICPVSFKATFSAIRAAVSCTDPTQDPRREAGSEDASR